MRDVLDEYSEGNSIEEFEKFFRNVESKYSFFNKIEQTKDIKLPTTIMDSP